MINKIYRNLRYDLPLHFVLLFTNWFPNLVFLIRLRGWLIRPFFKKCGRHLEVQRNVTFYNPSQIIIGNKVVIPYGCWITASGTGNIQIGDNAGLAPYVVIVSGGYDFIGGKRVPKSGEIIIGPGVWIGSNSTILQDVNIGENSVIAANTLVNTNVPPNCIFAGYPGKKICNLLN